MAFGDHAAANAGRDGDPLLPALSEQLSLRLVAVEELKSSKKALAQSANELLRRVNADVLALNKEIRRRNAESANDRRDEGAQLILDALPNEAQVY